MQKETVSSAAANKPPFVRLCSTFIQAGCSNQENYIFTFFLTNKLTLNKNLVQQRDKNSSSHTQHQ